MIATPDAKTLHFVAEGVRDGKLVIPIIRTVPLGKAARSSNCRGGAWYREGLAGGLILFCQLRIRKEDRK